jgi:hypothetical protein
MFSLFIKRTVHLYSEFAGKRIDKLRVRIAGPGAFIDQ